MSVLRLTPALWAGLGRQRDGVLGVAYWPLAAVAGNGWLSRLGLSMSDPWQLSLSCILGSHSSCPSCIPLVALTAPEGTLLLLPPHGVMS